MPLSNTHNFCPVADSNSGSFVCHELTIIENHIRNSSINCPEIDGITDLIQNFQIFHATRHKCLNQCISNPDFRNSMDRCTHLQPDIHSGADDIDLSLREAIKLGEISSELLKKINNSLMEEFQNMLKLKVKLEEIKRHLSIS
jgi:hypothetical protein